MPDTWATYRNGIKTINGAGTTPGTVTGDAGIALNDNLIAIAGQIGTVVASGTAHAAGTVPDPGATAGTTRYLREDATWAVPERGSRTTADVTITGVGAGGPQYADVTGLSFPIGANEVWSAEWHLQIQASAPGGNGIQLTGPSSPTDVMIQYLGSTSTANTLATTSSTAFSASITSFFTGAYTGGQWAVMRVSMCVNNGANAGTVQLQMGPTSSGNTVTVRKNSYVVARKH